MNAPFRVEFVPSAARDYRGLPEAIQTRVAACLEALAGEPLSGKPLQGPYHGLRSYRVGEFRIVYRVDAKARLIAVRRIGNRRDVYRRV